MKRQLQDRFDRAKKKRKVAIDTFAKELTDADAEINSVRELIRGDDELAKEAADRFLEKFFGDKKDEYPAEFEAISNDVLRITTDTRVFPGENGMTCEDWGMTEYLEILIKVTSKETGQSEKTW